jgi:ubiquinone/menaquinone biosynthesis C-methylase UbiE
LRSGQGSARTRCRWRWRWVQRALDVLDVQQEMLDAVVRRARAAGITNIASRQGDAAHLPYADQTFDGAYLITVLGEIPDGDSALRELARVLKPTGRLVIGELFVDPDFVSLRTLRARAEQAGFVFSRKVGSTLAYLARFEHRTEVRTAQKCKMQFSFAISDRFCGTMRPST